VSVKFCKSGSVVWWLGGIKRFMGWGAGEGASAPSPLWMGLGGFGLSGGSAFEVFAEQFHVEVAVLVDPFLMDLDGECAD
jgi:hypothetical protein